MSRIRFVVSRKQCNNYRYSKLTLLDVDKIIHIPIIGLNLLHEENNATIIDDKLKLTNVDKISHIPFSTYWIRNANLDLLT